MDLRDRFAAHFAAALVDAFADPDTVARRAYDLAEAMMLERAQRTSGDERLAIEAEPHLASLPPAAPLHHAALLDEPEPPYELDPAYDDDLDPRWLDPPYDPAWDIETRWNAEPSPRASTSPPPPQAQPQGPGLARTRPEEPQEEERKERLG